MRPASRLHIWWIGAAVIDHAHIRRFYAVFVEKEPLLRRERQQSAVKVSVFYFTLVITWKIVYNEVIILSSLVSKQTSSSFRKEVTYD